jgi:iron complex outermembrane recepter protein
MRHFLLFLLFVILTAFHVSAFYQTKPADTIHLEAIDVSATLIEGKLKKIPGSITVLTSGQLSAYSNISISEQLNSAPGIAMQSGAYNTNRIVIRGIGSRTPYSTNRVRAYINDIPLTNGDGVTLIEDIDVNQLGRVEIIKGPSSALYGSGLGGTIKLSTLNSTHTFRAGLQLGSFNTSKFSTSAGINNKSGNANIAFHRTYSDGYRENSRYLRNSAYATANKYLNNTSISFTAIFTLLDANIPSSVDIDTYETAPYRAAQNWLAAEGFEKQNRLLSGITIQHRINNNLSNKTTLFAGYREEYELRPFNHLEEESLNYGIRNQLHYQKGKLGAVAGIELFTENHHWRTFIPENNIENIVNNINETRSFGNIFATANYSAGENLLISAGLNANRINYQYRGLLNDADVYTFPVIVSPRAGFNYSTNENVNVYGSVSHGFSAPSLEETLLPDGEKNPDIKPEQGWMYETGIRISGLSKRLFIDATVYHIAISNLLVTKRISEAVFTGINAGRSNHSGFEAQVSYRVFSRLEFPGELRANSSFTISQNVFVDFEDDGNNYSGNHLPGIPQSIIFAGLEWQPIEGLTANFNTRYSGMQYLTDSNSNTIEGYWVSNLLVRHTVSIGNDISFEINGGINNLFNSHYASMVLPNAPGFGSAPRRYYYPALPRHFFLGLRVWF